MKRFARIVLITAMFLTLAACGGRQAAAPEMPVAGEQTETEAPLDAEGYPKYLPEHAPEAEGEASAEAGPTEEQWEREQRLRAYLDGMTLEEKVGQLFFARCPETDAAEKIAEYHLGGVLLFTRDYRDADGNWLTKDAVIDKLQSYQAAADIPLFIGSDEEGGTVTRASRNPYLFPSVSRSPQELYAAGGLGAILNDTAEKSYILRELGVNVNFAPVCDVSVDPSDFIYARSLGRNAAETMAYAAGVVLVMGDAGMGSVLKHFPGYGNNVDTHTGVAVDERPIETFRNNDFLPFRAGIEAHGKIEPFVLVSHNIVTCMDAGLPASLSPAVHQLLRGELGFDGVILTDDLDMDAVQAYAEDGSAAVLALLAGNDMIVTGDFEPQIAEVLSAAADGTLDERVIDEACLRVLRAKEARFAMPWEIA